MGRTPLTDLPRSARSIVVPDHVWNAVAMASARATLEGRGKITSSEFVREAIEKAVHPDDLAQALAVAKQGKEAEDAVED